MSAEEIFPVPLQVGQTSWVFIVTSGFMRCRVICMSPNFEMGNTACLALSVRMKPSIASISFRLLSGSFMSIKSTTKIPQPQLPRNFLGGFHIGFQGVLLLVIAHALIAAVYVDDVQGLRMLNNKIGPAGEIHRLPKRCLYLLCHTELVEDRGAIVVIRN